MTVEAQKETLGFQTEVNQLLHLVVHSLYSNKEIFLRELVSNASDALDKLRFGALSNNDLYGDDANLNIRIDYDETNKTVTIADNGIGMTREQVIDHLGTIAKSGTKEFLSKLTGNQKQDSNLIGQFGVGFYSAFIVADKVTVKTRAADVSSDKSVQWTSTGEGGYTIESITKATRGTEVILHLKKEEEEFASDWRLRSIISKYSDHICWPIIMKKTTENEETKKTEITEETVNKAQAVWTLQKNEIKDEGYKALYKHISHDFEDPLTWIHNHVEGKLEYISLLYIPSKAPFDLWQQETKHGLKLFVKRVFIMDDAAQFLPRYLRFIKGIIDSSDLPLNVSREILQDNQAVETIQKACIKRVLSQLEKMSKNEPDTYKKFWQEFGLVLKEGPIEDVSNKDKIAKLLRFSTTHLDSSEQSVSLEDYVSRMKPGQDKIYYITAASYNTAKNSPHMEVFRKKDIEVVLLYDRVDEWLINHLSEFDGKHLQSITKGELNLGELEDKDESSDIKQQEENFASLIKQVKDVLAEQVKEVRITKRLTDSPACVVADAHDMGREMERILQAAGQAMPASKPIFELNPDHPIVQKLNAEVDDARFADWTHILFDQALLSEGSQLEDPGQFVKRLNQMLLTLSK